MSLEQKYHLLGSRNESTFPRVDGTPHFSSFIADLAIKNLLRDEQQSKRNVWDPYCGNGVILRTLAVLYRPWIDRLYASDVRSDAVDQTKENLSQCSFLAYQSRDSFRELLEQCGCDDQVEVTAFQHDAITSNTESVADDTIEVLITDPPYEVMESYFESVAGQPCMTMQDYLPILLKALRRKMRDGAKVGFVLDQGDDYREVLGAIEGYKFNERQQLHPSYKNRIFYALSAR